MNIAATTIEDYAIVKTIDFERKFEAPTQYLLPIPSADINRNEKLVNNPVINLLKRNEDEKYCLACV